MASLRLIDTFKWTKKIFHFEALSAADLIYYWFSFFLTTSWLYSWFINAIKVVNRKYWGKNFSKSFTEEFVFNCAQCVKLKRKHVSTCCISVYTHSSIIGLVFCILQKKLVDPHLHCPSPLSVFPLQHAILKGSCWYSMCTCSVFSEFPVWTAHRTIEFHTMGIYTPVKWKSTPSPPPCRTQLGQDPVNHVDLRPHHVRKS